MLACSKFFFGLLLIFAFPLSSVFAQSKVPLLEKKISLTAENVSVEDALNAIGEQGGFSFSYTPDAVLNHDKVSFRISNRPVREFLNTIFEGSIDYKEKGKHIILVKSGKQKPEDKDEWYIIKGYIKDNEGDEISEVSIFDKKSRESTISNKYGFFNLKIDGKHADKEVLLFFNKVSYKDTLIYVRQSGNSIINITLYPEEKSHTSADSLAIKDSLMRADQMAFIQFLLSEESRVNTRNIRDTIFQKYQVSFIPFIGTNLRLSGNTVNDYSLNVLGGYSMGTRKAELGGLFNIDRDSVKYFQAAGLLNFNGGPMSGVQLGGLANVNLDPVQAVQAAGLLNVNADTTKGIMLSGLLNVNLKSAQGIQAAGLLNTSIAKESKLSQVSGLINVCTGSTRGVQISPVLNVCLSEISGAQVSSLINIAGTIKGTQIGLLNISDSCNGAPIGLLSYVHKGYHQLEISTDELYPVNVSVRSGVRSFYNILSAGMMLDSMEDIQWYFGYGLGTAAQLGRNWQLNIDLSMNQALHGNTLKYFAPLSKLQVTVEKRFSKFFSIAAGPSLNYLVYNSKDDYLQTLAGELPGSVFSKADFSDSYLSRAWVGGKLALRFF